MENKAHDSNVVCLSARLGVFRAPPIPPILTNSALAYDPLLTSAEIQRSGAEPWAWGHRDSAVRAIVTQTADPAWHLLDAAWFPGLRLLLDGRNSLRDLAIPEGATYRGIGGRR